MTNALYDSHPGLSFLAGDDVQPLGVLPTRYRSLPGLTYTLLDHTKADASNKPLWEWDPRLHQYRHLATGQIIGAKRMLELRDLYTDRQSLRAEQLTAQLVRGDISLQDWLLRQRQLIKDTYLSQYAMAKGGRSQMTPQDYGRIGAALKKQYEYLQAFGQDIQSGKYRSANPENLIVRIANRIKLYIESATQAFEKGKIAVFGGNLYDYLSRVPGDGQTRCRTRCRCHLRIVEQEDGWLVYWVLDPAAEHCDDCVKLSEQWNPLRVPKPRSVLKAVVLSRAGTYHDSATGKFTRRPAGFGPQTHLAVPHSLDQYGNFLAGHIKNPQSVAEIHDFVRSNREALAKKASKTFNEPDILRVPAVRNPANGQIMVFGLNGSHQDFAHALFPGQTGKQRGWEDSHTRFDFRLRKDGSVESITFNQGASGVSFFDRAWDKKSVRNIHATMNALKKVEGLDERTKVIIEMTPLDSGESFEVETSLKAIIVTEAGTYHDTATGKFTHKPGAAAQPVTTFHGTVPQILQEVTANGLKPGKSWHGRAPSVYVAEDPDMAMHYAFERARNRPFNKTDIVQGIVFELEIPADQAGELIFDTKEPGLLSAAKNKEGWRLEKPIPPSWIKSYTIYQLDMDEYFYGDPDKSFKPKQTVALKATSPRFFVPILLVTPGQKAVVTSPAGTSHDSATGQFAPKQGGAKPVAGGAPEEEQEAEADAARLARELALERDFLEQEVAVATERERLDMLEGFARQRQDQEIAQRQRTEDTLQAHKEYLEDAKNGFAEATQEAAIRQAEQRADLERKLTHAREDRLRSHQKQMRNIRQAAAADAEEMERSRDAVGHLKRQKARDQALAGATQSLGDDMAKLNNQAEQSRARLGTQQEREVEAMERQQQRQMRQANRRLGKAMAANERAYRRQVGQQERAEAQGQKTFGEWARRLQEDAAQALKDQAQELAKPKKKQEGTTHA
ncbi:MAG: hypothetical protein KJ077_10555 [Anaerolineae bacterium]|nr:hypothetical protein [Anaerolineae bacterium]